MNAFRIIGDIFHLVSILWLLVKLIKTRSCGGISGKTQLLFALVFSTRYLDLFSGYISTYNTAFKITYIVCSYVTVLLILVVFQKSYRSTEDSFLTEIILLPTFVLALYANNIMEPVEILWAFSIYLESVAILPQFYMIYKKGELERSLLYYLIPLGLYRLFYIFNWIYRYNTEGHIDKISDGAGIIYVIVYLLALLEFCTGKVKVTDEENGKFLKKNIFFISSNEPFTVNGEKTLSSEQLIDGNV
ncbi:ER lumen protein-retaining receptor 1 [Anoplophora glabripennis]|uniref:ER lumen protein-retaining receptor 1 n=1 Tax=Anoplophora glabripennis TaxID=217634 RepID=UPI0008755AD9|nr:ER lumen protein-retaining receptor 1 [Anoplophora glabripennis]